MQHDDEHDGHHADNEGRDVDLPEVDDEIERSQDAVGAFGLIAGEVVELAEHDVDADRGDEARHHRVRHEPQEGAESQETSDDHHQAGEHRQCVQRTSGVVTAGEIDVGDDDRHRAGALNRHEGGAREQCPSGEPEHVAVEPGDRVDAGEQSGRQAVGHTFHAEDQAGHRILSRRLSPEQRTRGQDREPH